MAEMDSRSQTSLRLPSFASYPEQPSSVLLDRLCQVVSDLSALYGEIAMIEAQNIRDKAHVLQTSGESSSNGRRDRVNMQVVEGPATAIELAGQRDALVEEKWLLARILDSRRS